MKKLVLDIVILGSIGMVIAGIFNGWNYQVLSHFAFLLYTVTMAYEYRLVMHGHGNPIIGVFWFMLYAIFLYQYISIVVTGVTVNPNIWWAFHAGIAGLILLLIRDKHNKYVC